MNDSWLSRWAGPCTEGYECPFEDVRVIPENVLPPPNLPPPDGIYEIVGLRQGEERSVHVTMARLSEIALDHLRSRHGVTDPLEATLEQSGHAVAVAAVACLMD